MVQEGGIMPGKATLGRSSPKDTLATHKVAGGVRGEGGRLRQSLANPEIARKAAKAATTRAINRGWTVAGKPPIYSGAEAEHLKTGVSNMMSRIDPTDASMKAKIEAMDADKLATLYRNNKFVFEVYFQYEGIQRKGNTYTAEPSKKKDAQFLIDEYERAFGAL